MNKFMTVAVWWLVLTGPVVGYAVYEFVRHPQPHPETGPHGGRIVEWDERHETVAEVVIDRQCGIVTVYVLDSSAKRSRDIQARSITLDLDAPTPITLKLVSVPRGWDHTDWASQFNSGRVLEPGDKSRLAGTLRVTTNGRQFVGGLVGDQGED
jgi:hypothetical protein